ncbi:deoxyribose-phosphate aldolase [Dermatobacter hominis]|uniref:deoxyribose-phosphate aldolase n=1 Tax=Dermatobacter hominis TaxID=2884263 RepID=UPI001D0FDA18|nr:deoxyribose-phosphate aldolase [Dermatobacter hominis]UDY37716.1 deoxyribose-phosphate aldolase [Dermatobacter hominis]
MPDHDAAAPARSGIDRRALAARIDHTLLRPEATVAEVLDQAAIAVSTGCASVCVQPAMVAAVVGAVGDRIPVCSVVGFPHGASLSRSKADEAAAVVALGAAEVDVVADLGALADGDLAAVAADVAAVREAVPNVVLKVILESALWSPAVLRQACEAVVGAGADYVKTSTGFHPAGGASVDAVAVMRDAVGDRARVKASGGIRNTAAALAAIDAGADRLGLSATVAVLDGLA